MEFVPLKSLDRTAGSVPVQVRVCRVWEALNTKTDMLISLDLIVADSEGTPMWVQIKNSMVRRFRHLLSVGCVYSLKNFTVSPVTGQYRPVTTSNKLAFTLNTTVKKVSVPVPSIPVHVFQFVTHATVVERSGDPTYLTDIVSRLISVGDCEAVSGRSVKRDLEVLTSVSGKVRVTLWDDLAKSFVSAHKLTSSTAPVCVIITSLKVKQFADSFSFSSTSATHIFANLEHESVTQLHAQLPATTEPVIFLGRSPGVPGTTAEAMTENRMVISEILEAGWAGEKPGYKITFAGCIYEVSTKYGWYYLGCTPCKSKVNLVDGHYRCGKCSTTVTSPTVLYKLQFSVTDKIDTLQCTAMNNVAECMVDSAAMKLFNRLEAGSTTFPQQLLDLCGQEFIFKIALSKFNVQSGSDSFTVVDIFTPDEKVCVAAPPSAGKDVLESVDGSGSNVNAAASTDQVEVNLTPRKRKLRRTYCSDNDDTEDEAEDEQFR